VIVADDLTGAMDAAAPFARRGLDVRVLTTPGKLESVLDHLPEVLSINTGTRHVSGQQAADVVAALVGKLVRLKPQLLFKKIDSTLRGNLLTETLAALKASGYSEMLVCPAVPAQGRTLTGGKLYIDGVPLHETDIGRDLRTPPPRISLAEMYRAARQNTAVMVEAVAAWQATRVDDRRPRVSIVDAESGDQLSGIAAAAVASRAQILFAGAAGLSEALAEAMFDGEAPALESASMPGKFLFVVGSRAQETAAQVEALIEAYPETLVADLVDALPLDGSTLSRLPRSGQTPAVVMLRAPSVASCPVQDPDQVAIALAESTSSLLAAGPTALLLATGGDTVLAVLNELGVEVIQVCGEIMPGIVHGLIDTRHGPLRLVTKAGGFGSRQLFCTVIDHFLSCRGPVERAPGSQFKTG
jgi:uncharacterized protein YgbK (DUF1537 family)